MSRLIVEYFTQFVDLLLLMLFIVGFIACAYLLEDKAIGLFKWPLCLVIPFIAEIFIFGPLLLFIDIRNSAVSIEKTMQQILYNQK